MTCSPVFAPPSKNIELNEHKTNSPKILQFQNQISQVKKQDHQAKTQAIENDKEENDPFSDAEPEILANSNAVNQIYSTLPDYSSSSSKKLNKKYILPVSTTSHSYSKNVTPIYEFASTSKERYAEDVVEPENTDTVFLENLKDKKRQRTKEKLRQKSPIKPSREKEPVPQPRNHLTLNPDKNQVSQQKLTHNLSNISHHKTKKKTIKTSETSQYENSFPMGYTTSVNNESNFSISNI